MRYDDLSEAMRLTRRFLEIAGEARTRLEEEGCIEKGGVDGGYIETAACNRASMDLTRALAQLRDPYRRRNRKGD